MTHVDIAHYRAYTCGVHQIFVRSIPVDNSARAATTSSTFKVTSDPVIAINDLIAYVSAPAYPPRFRSSMLIYLNNAKRSFTRKQIQAGTIQMQVRLNLVQGGAFFILSNVQQALAISMKDLIGCI